MEIKVELNEGYRKKIKEAMLATMGINKISDPEQLERRLSKPLTNKTFKSLLVGRHSPIKRGLIYIDALVPDRVMTHLTRHHETLHWVATSRPDISYHREVEDGMRFMSFQMDFKRLIEVSQLRLCGKSWHETTELFEMIRFEIYSLDKTLYSVLHPSCVWANGKCPETGCCGYIGKPLCDVDIDSLWNK